MAGRVGRGERAPEAGAMELSFKKKKLEMLSKKLEMLELEEKSDLDMETG